MQTINEEIFRAYDIRGTYPTTINEQVAFTIGKSYGSYLQEKYNKNTCIVSHDNRLSSETLTQNLIKGLVSSGINIISLGFTTTPMNYYARYLNQMPGIMVTASHNPKDDNGFKMSFDGMINARGDMIEDFKKYTYAGVFKNGQGRITNTNITDKYLEYLKFSIKYGKNKRKVVIDAGNGATTHIIRKVFDNAFCHPIYINDISDGSFPNHHPDPAVPENMVQLQRAVKENKADFGVAYDGDGDRIGVVMENGELINPDPNYSNPWWRGILGFTKDNELITGIPSVTNYYNLHVYTEKTMKNETKTIQVAGVNPGTLSETGITVITKDSGSFYDLTGYTVMEGKYDLVRRLRKNRLMSEK